MARRREVDRDELRERRDKVATQVLSERLPGWEEFLEENAEAAKWIAEYDHRIGAAIHDGDAVLFERALGTWRKAWHRVNLRIAEQYRQDHPDPETWSLHYFKWMVKVHYIEFESELGNFLLYPQRPSRKPHLTHWYTADQMIAMLEDNVAATIKTFGVLPVQPSQLKPPGEGEKHMQIDLTRGAPVITYEIPRRKR